MADQLFDVEQMHDFALGTLEEWVAGYTDSLSDGHQRRISIINITAKTITVKVEKQGLHGGHDRQPRYFVIGLDVEEVSDEDAAAITSQS